jgi:hypothetical protein
MVFGHSSDYPSDLLFGLVKVFIELNSKHFALLIELNLPLPNLLIFVDLLLLVQFMNQFEIADFVKIESFKYQLL